MIHVGEQYVSQDANVYGVIKVDETKREMTVKVIKESEVRKPDPLGTEYIWRIPDFEEMVDDGDFILISYGG